MRLKTLRKLVYLGLVGCLEGLDAALTALALRWYADPDAQWIAAPGWRADPAPAEARDPREVDVTAALLAQAERSRSRLRPLTLADPVRYQKAVEQMQRFQQAERDSLLPGAVPLIPRLGARRA